MKRILVVLILTLAVTGYAAAQVTSPTGDILGAHNVYGRGCEACHAVHSGAPGNGGPATANSGNLALWGEDLSPLYGQTLTFAGGDTVTIPNFGTTPVTVGGVTYPGAGLPSSLDTAPPATVGLFIINACLSCHDGNIAVVGMMKGSTVETVNINGHIFNPPTLLGNDGTTPGNYLNDHPVGPQALLWCGAYGWDCTVNGDGSITFGGPNQTAFFNNYFNTSIGNGALANLVQAPGAPFSPFPGFTQSAWWVTCTTCHDQHNMQYFNAGTTPNGTVVGPKKTHFFVRGWYDPGNTNTSNSAAQFCRSCHGGESNEMNGQLGIPTT